MVVRSGKEIGKKKDCRQNEVRSSCQSREKIFDTGGVKKVTSETLNTSPLHSQSNQSQNLPESTR